MTWPLVVFVAECIAVAAAVTWLVLWLLPGPRARRADRRILRDLDKAARRPHRHDWTKWGEPSETRIYAAGTSLSGSNDALPVRRDFRQVRSCRECGQREVRRYSP